MKIVHVFTPLTSVSVQLSKAGNRSDEESAETSQGTIGCGSGKDFQLRQETVAFERAVSRPCSTKPEVDVAQPPGRPCRRPTKTTTSRNLWLILLCRCLLRKLPSTFKIATWLKAVIKCFWYAVQAFLFAIFITESYKKRCKFYLFFLKFLCLFTAGFESKKK